MQEQIASLPLHGIMLLIITLTEMVLNFGRIYVDSTVYIKLAITGSSPYRGVMIRFMLPFVASVVWKVTGYSSSLAALSVIISLINCLFWGGAVVVSYDLGFLLRDRATGFFIALFFTTSVPVLAYGSAVLTDMSGYFFVGLALLVLLADRKVTRLRAATEGAILAVGGFFHLIAFLGLTFVFVRRLPKRSALDMLAGSALVLVPVGLIAFIGGWFKRGLPYVGALISPYHLAQGPRLDEALTYTFGFLWLYYPGEALQKLLPGSNIPNLAFAFFVLIVICGIYAVPRRLELLGYLLVMSVITIIGARFIERYLFYMWPCMLPILIFGLGSVAGLPNYVLEIVARHGLHLGPLKWVAERLGRHQNLFVLCCLSIIAVFNTLNILTALGPSPFLR